MAAFSTIISGLHVTATQEVQGGWSFPDEHIKIKGVCLDKFRDHILELASQTNPYSKVTFLLKTL